MTMLRHMCVMKLAFFDTRHFDPVALIWHSGQKSAKRLRVYRGRSRCQRVLCAGRRHGSHHNAGFGQLDRRGICDSIRPAIRVSAMNILLDLNQC